VLETACWFKSSPGHTKACKSLIYKPFLLPGINNGINNFNRSFRTMDKPEKYTFEDWFSGKNWYEKESDLNPIGIYALNGEDCDFESMKLFLNRPLFIHAAGEMEAEDLKKVQAEQTRLFKLILDEQVEAGMKLRLRDLEPLWKDKLVIQARLNALEKLVLEDGRGQILFNLLSGSFPRLDNLTGPEYIKINGGATARGEYANRRADSTLRKYIEVGLLHAEIAAIKERAVSQQTQPVTKVERRGSHFKSDEIEMGDDFYAEARRLYQEALKAGRVDTHVRSNRKGAVSGAFVKKLRSFFGYVASDGERLYPKKPSLPTIKRILVKHRDRWEN